MDRRADRYDLLWASALGGLTVLSRLPYRARMLYNWDAVQFALALGEYDVVKHQPHPPGYILYVVLGYCVNAWVGDAASAYVTLGVVFSGLTTVAVYFVAREMYVRHLEVRPRNEHGPAPLRCFDELTQGGERVR